MEQEPKSNGKTITMSKNTPITVGLVIVLILASILVERRLSNLESRVTYQEQRQSVAESATSRIESTLPDKYVTQREFNYTMNTVQMSLGKIEENLELIMTKQGIKRIER